MTHRSPLITLVGLVAAFAIMFGVNLASSAPRDSYAGGASPTAPASTPPASPASTPPAASVEPTPTAAATARPDESEFPNKIVYAGYTNDDSTAIAVAILGTRAAAYLCDGDSVEAWLRGTVDGDEMSLTGKNGARLEAELDGRRLEGTIEVNDEKLDFTIREAKRPAGLYRAKGSKTTIGWIVLPNGSQVGIQTTGEESTPAPKLDPANPEVTVDGEQLEGEAVSGDLDV
ncbi:MAG TPA: hypothetical protein VLJ88_13905 [Propionibacteriaceae bacterium]|nr:hypothetical protein [Propionibacteriaceae bacterium]